MVVAKVMAPSQAGRRSALESMAFLPFYLIIFARVMVLEAGGYHDLSDDSPTKTALTILAYLLAGGLLFLRPPSLKPYASLLLPYAVYVVYSSMTLFWTLYPEVAAMRVIHQIGTVLVCLLAAEWAFARPRQAITTLAFFVSPMLIASLIVAVFFPERGVVKAEWSQGEAFGARWLGLTVHPNILGAIAWVSIWLSIWSFLTSTSKFVRFYMASMIAVSFLLIYGSDSRSSAYVTAVVIAMYFVSSSKPLGPGLGADKEAAFSINSARLLLVVIVGLIVGSIAFVLPELVGLSVRKGGVGIVSGRNAIWALGLDAFLEFPFGWGQDQLMTFWSSHYAVERFPHFHDGFIDVMVRTGFVGLICMFFFLLMTGRAIHRIRGRAALFRPLWVFFYSFLFYNLTETAIDREAAVWTMFVFVCLVAGRFAAAYPVEVASASPNSMSRRRLTPGRTAFARNSNLPYR